MTSSRGHGLLIPFSGKPFPLSYLKFRYKCAHLTLACLVPPARSFLRQTPSSQMLQGIAITCLRVSSGIRGGCEPPGYGDFFPVPAQAAGAAGSYRQKQLFSLPQVGWGPGHLWGQGSGPCLPLLTTSIPTVVLALSSFHTPRLST